MPRFIEINFVPLLSSAFPEETLYVDTRLSWEDGRGHEKTSESLKTRLLRLRSAAKEAKSIPAGIGIQAVVVRARGSENVPTLGPKYLLKKFLGRALHRLAFDLAKKHHCKLVVVDRADEATIHPNDRWILGRCDIYLKRELPWSVWSAFELIKPSRICIGCASAIPELQRLAKKLKPLSLGIEDHLVAGDEERPCEFVYDVFYLGKSYGIKRRLMIENELERLEQAGIRVFRTAGPLPREEFLNMIRASKIAISPGGVGWDCFRHYEIPACGTAMLLERPSHQAYMPPKENDEAIYYDPNAPVLPIVRQWLSDSVRLEKLATAGQSWVRTKHTYSSLGRHIESLVN